MKNYILNFDKETVDNYIVSDYKSKDIKLYLLLDELKHNNEITNYLNLFQIDENDKIERICYDIYGTTDYWDLILLINEKMPLFDMIYDNDTIFNSVTEQINYYDENIYPNKPLNLVRKDELIEEFIEDQKIINEKNKYIYVIKPTKVGDFLKLLRDKDYL